MPDAYYANVRSGESYADATVHASRDCDELDEDPRPRQLRAEAVEESGVEKCEECRPLESPSDGDTVGGEDHSEPTTEEYIEDGICPWCDDYEGDHVGQHASSAHPESWDGYKG